MTTTITEIADHIFRISTLTDVLPGGFTFNQFFIDDDEPLLFHTGPRAMFPQVLDALNTVSSAEMLRWVSFGHWEADESGALNDWLTVAPHAQLAIGAMGNMLSGNDQAMREPRSLGNGEVLALGSKQVQWIDTPHVPHGWDAGLLIEQTTKTLFCGDLFTQTGDKKTTSDDVVGPANEVEDFMGSTSLTPKTAPTIRQLAEHQPLSLALMHGPTFTGDCVRALTTLADDYEARLRSAIPA